MNSFVFPFKFEYHLSVTFVFHLKTNLPHIPEVKQVKKKQTNKKHPIKKVMIDDVLQ